MHNGPVAGVTPLSLVANLATRYQVASHIGTLAGIVLLASPRVSLTITECHRVAHGPIYRSEQNDISPHFQLQRRVAELCKMD